MRKVGDESHLEDRLEFYRKHLETCRAGFDGVLSSEGLESALGSDKARNLAQYWEVVRVLEELSGGDPVDNLSRISGEVVKALRDSDTPRWRVLALATVLEVLVASV